MKPDRKIHPTAVIDPQARLGQNVGVGPFSVIGADVDIGDDCEMGPHVVIYPNTTIGPSCKVHAGAVLGDLPQDLAFKGGISRVRIGTGCVLREGVTIHRGTRENTDTVLGDRCFLMANSHVGHNDRLGNDVILANGVLLAGYVDVGDRSFISGNSVVHQFVRIGRLSMLAGLSAISKDVPPFCSTRGVEGNVIFGMNVVGMRRAGISVEERIAIKKAFGILYRSGLNVSQALERLRAEFSAGPASEFASFIESSRRGICRFVTSGQEDE